MKCEKCPHCGRRIPLNRYSLNRNMIVFLFDFMRLSRGKDFVETSEVYKGITFKGSVTAELTQLMYFGALIHFSSDVSSTLSRSGKWVISIEGLNFLLGKGSLPSYVIVENRKVIEQGDGVYISSAKLKWDTEQDIWKNILEFQSEP